MAESRRATEALFGDLWPAICRGSDEDVATACAVLARMGCSHTFGQLMRSMRGITRQPFLGERAEMAPRPLRRYLASTWEVARSVADWPYEWLSDDCRRARLAYLWSERYLWLCACSALCGGGCPEDVANGLQAIHLTSRTTSRLHGIALSGTCALPRIAGMDA